MKLRWFFNPVQRSQYCCWMLTGLLLLSADSSGLGRLAPAPRESFDFQDVGSLEGTKGAWQRMGYPDRMFVIDNTWDFKRYKQVLPKLPEVDLQKKHLLVVISWYTRPRKFLKPTTDGDTLVVHVEEERVRRITEDKFIPPKFVVAQVAAWAGPIRFEVNGKPQFTLWKGKQLEEQTAKQWKEIKRLYEGGQPTMAQRVAANRPSWGEGTPDEKIAADLANRPRISNDEMKSIFKLEFRPLADMRATPVVEKIFQLSEQLREFDPAFEGAWHALAAIGGPEVVAGCEKALKSKNRFAQHLAIAVACDLGLPEIRPLYHLGLACSYAPVVRGGMNGLTRIGWGKEDVPALIGILERVDQFGDEVDVVKTAIFHLVSLGSEGAPALPVLEKLRMHRIVSLREEAAKAIDKIKGATKNSDRMP